MSAESRNQVNSVIFLGLAGFFLAAGAVAADRPGTVAPAAINPLVSAPPTDVSPPKCASDVCPPPADTKPPAVAPSPPSRSVAAPSPTPPVSADKTAARASANLPTPTPSPPSPAGKLPVAETKVIVSSVPARELAPSATPTPVISVAPPSVRVGTTVDPLLLRPSPTPVKMELRVPPPPVSSPPATTGRTAENIPVANANQERGISANQKPLPPLRLDAEKTVSGASPVPLRPVVANVESARAAPTTATPSGAPAASLPSVQKLSTLPSAALVASPPSPTAPGNIQGNVPSAAVDATAVLLPRETVQPLKSLSALPSAPKTTPANRPSRETDQLLLYWPDAGAAQRDLAKIQREFGIAPAEKTVLNSLGGVVVQFRNISRQDVATLQQRIRQSVPAASVNFNAIYYPDAGPRQYFSGRVGLTVADGPAVSIGIVDGEVFDIPALAKAKIIRRSFLSGGDRPAVASHATAIASLIAGRDQEHGFSGVATAAPLHVASVMRNDGDQDSTTTLLLAKALDWLLAQNVRVINLSLGGPGDPLMAQLFEKLARMPVVIVAAAGNGGPDAPPSYPAAYPGVLAVTATNAADSLYSKANRGSYVALAAPGEDLWVPLPGDGQYVSGTSFAAALTSGAVSRVLALKQEWDSASVRRHLCRYAREIGNSSRTESVSGCGLLQLGAALEPLKPVAVTAGKQ